MKSIPLFILCFLFFLPTQAQRRKKDWHYKQHFVEKSEILAEKQKINRIAMTICGHYSNKVQADTLNHPYYQSQELIYVPIWKEKRHGEHWFYLGWFAEGLYEQALGEFIFKIERINRDTFEARYFLLEKHLSLEWQKPHAFQHLRLKDLKEGEGCTALLFELEPGKVLWEANAYCHHVLSEQIQFHKIKMLFSYDEIKEYTQYYDEQKQVVFALPEELPCHFLRQSTYVAPKAKQR